MQAIQRGKSAAFDTLYARYSERMYGYFYKMLWQDEAKANDFTQELFLKIIEKPKAFNSKRTFSTWFYTLANNMCKNEYRKHHNKTKVYSTIQSQTDILVLNDNQYDKNTFQKDLDKALNMLPEAHRACFILKYKEEKTIPEISKILNCPEGTVKSRLYHATRKLSIMMKGWMNELVD
jgi:RNA polymerase sigma-70 factor (ECF subfamily)